MAQFIYQVKDERGRTFRGTIEAENVKEVRRKLRNSGYYVVGVYPQPKKGKIFFLKKGVSLDTLFIFTHQLSSMIESGLPILLSLDILWRHIENIRMQLVISRIKNSLSKGKSLSQAIGEFPYIFPPIYRALMTVAETGGGLVPVLKKLTEYLETQKKFISKIKRAMTYPIIVMVFALCVLFLMLWVVVPTFQKVFAKLKVELPSLTQFVLDLSSFTKSLFFWIILGAIIVGGYVSYKILLSKPSFRLMLDKVKLKLPVLGKVIYTASLARFVRSLGLLLGAGLSAAKSMEVARKTVVNKYLEQSLEWVEKRIVEGVSFSEALRETELFPNVLIEMIAVGERSGTLVEMLEKMAIQFDEELDFRLNKFLTFLEPALIIIVGGMVAFVLVAIYLPIFTLWGSLGMMR